MGMREFKIIGFETSFDLVKSANKRLTENIFYFVLYGLVWFL
jgi:hypothetical protein